MLTPISGSRVCRPVTPPPCRSTRRLDAPPASLRRALRRRPVARLDRRWSRSNRKQNRCNWRLKTRKFSRLRRAACGALRVELVGPARKSQFPLGAPPDLRTAQRGRAASRRPRPAREPPFEASRDVRTSARIPNRPDRYAVPPDSTAVLSRPARGGRARATKIRPSRAALAAAAGWRHGGTRTIILYILS